MASRAQKVGVRIIFLCWWAVKSYNINAWDTPPPYIKHFSTDLRKSQEGSEHKWGVRTHPFPPWRRHCNKTYHVSVKMQSWGCYSKKVSGGSEGPKRVDFLGYTRIHNSIHTSASLSPHTTGETQIATNQAVALWCHALRKAAISIARLRVYHLASVILTFYGPWGGTTVPQRSKNCDIFKST